MGAREEFIHLAWDRILTHNPNSTPTRQSNPNPNPNPNPIPCLQRFIRLTAMQWVQEFIHLAWDRLIDFYSDLLSAIMHCISDNEMEIRHVSKTQILPILPGVRRRTDM